MMNRFRALVLVVVVLVSLMVATGATAQRQTLPPWRVDMPPARTTAAITVGDTPLTVDLALAPAEQQLGLGYRNGLKPGTGMLFVFPEAAPRTFWMKGMRFCLDIIWVNGGEIVGAAENACPDPVGTKDVERATFNSEVPVTHVLEMPGGWLAEHGYGSGTPVQIPEPLASVRRVAMLRGL